MKTKRIIDIETRVLPDGGATCKARLNYEAPAESAKTAVAKAMMALNSYCQTQKLDFFLVAHDMKTSKPLKISFTDSAVTP